MSPDPIPVDGHRLAPPHVWVPACALMLCVAGYAVFIVVPYLVNDLDRLPLWALASGWYDPKDMWPRNAPLWAVIWGWGGVLTLLAGPLVTVASGVGSAALMWRNWRRLAARQRFVLVATAAGSAALIATLLSPWGSALRTWWLD